MKVTADLYVLARMAIVVSTDVENCAQEDRREGQEKEEDPDHTDVLQDDQEAQTGNTTPRHLKKFHPKNMMKVKRRKR